MKSKACFQLSSEAARVSESRRGGRLAPYRPVFGLTWNASLEDQRTRPDEVSEPLPLRGIEQLMELAHRLHDGRLETLRARRFQGRGFLCLRLDERLRSHRFGERREATPLVHRVLRTLGLELVQDSGELDHLRLREAELVREESKGTTNSESTSTGIGRGLTRVGVTPG
jgi:hypothetical protein